MDTPVQLPNALTERIEHYVHTRTGGNIRNLRVDIDHDMIVLSGQTGSYYNKQLATHAVLAALTDADLKNDITVC